MIIQCWLLPNAVLTVNCVLTPLILTIIIERKQFVLLGNFSPSFSRRDGLIHTTLRVMLKYIPASRMMDQVMLIQEDFVGGDKYWYSCTQLGKLCKLTDLVISSSLPEVVWGFLYDFMQVQPCQCLLILLPFSFQEHIIQHRKKNPTPLPLHLT